MAAHISTAKSPYDPVKAVDGMFNGSVIRIASFFKDPLAFGPDTKRVLSETSKRFQDALDDCEIQILEAKWFLEHQLALNKTCREAKVLEEGGAEKRKLSKMQEVAITDDLMDVTQTPPKRPKLVEEEQEPELQAESAEAKVESHVEESTPGTAVDKIEQDKTLFGPRQETSKPQLEVLAGPDSSAQPVLRPPTADGILKETPHDTPANEAFNFESMFGEPSGGAEDSNVNFDLNMDPESFESNIDLDDPSSLNILLPGVESYANQGADDEGFNFSIDETMDHVNAGTTVNDFNLPEMGNAFDSLLEGNDFSGTIDGTDDILNDNSMLDMDSLDRLLG